MDEVSMETKIQKISKDDEQLSSTEKEGEDGFNCQPTDDKQKVSNSNDDVEKDYTSDNTFSFNKLDVGILRMSALLVILDHFTDWMSVKSVFYIRDLYIPLLVSIILPTILNLPQNIKRVRSLKDKNQPYYRFIPMSILTLLGFTVAFDMMTTARRMKWFRRGNITPDRGEYENIINKQVKIADTRQIELSVETVCITDVNNLKI